MRERSSGRSLALGRGAAAVGFRSAGRCAGRQRQWTARVPRRQARCRRLLAAALTGPQWSSLQSRRAKPRHTFGRTPPGLRAYTQGAPHAHKRAAVPGWRRSTAARAALGPSLHEHMSAQHAGSAHRPNSRPPRVAARPPSQDNRVGSRSSSLTWP